MAVPTVSWTNVCRRIAAPMLGPTRCRVNVGAVASAVLPILSRSRAVACALRVGHRGPLDALGPAAARREARTCPQPRQRDCASEPGARSLPRRHRRSVGPGAPAPGRPSRWDKAEQRMASCRQLLLLGAARSGRAAASIRRRRRWQAGRLPLHQGRLPPLPSVWQSDSSSDVGANLAECLVAINGQLASLVPL